MLNDIVQHLSSNSNPSDPSFQQKMTKLEAQLVGKSNSSTSSVFPALQSSAAAPEDEALLSSSDSDDDKGEECLIQHNTKRQRVEEDDFCAVQQSEGVADVRTKVVETVDRRPNPDDSNRKRQGRGRGHSAMGRGRGSKATDQMRSLVSSSTNLQSNGHLEHASYKETGREQQYGNDERVSLQEEITSLRGKVVSLEEDLSKSRQETSDHQQSYRQLEKELKDLKERDQQMKAKRIKVLYDLLISVLQVEREETRMKIHQESLRLGNVGVIRAGTMVSETWEDGKMLKDINARLKSLLETKEANERHRKSLKK